MQISRRKANTVFLLTALLSSCSRPGASSAAATPVGASPAVVATVAASGSPTPTATQSPVASLTPSGPIPLFDGRIKDGQLSLPDASKADAQLVKAEINAHLSQSTPRFYVEQGAPRSPEVLKIQVVGEGAYTRTGAKQTLFFYRADSTNGLVVVEGGKVVAHYTGNPGDYALYTYVVPVDANADGLTDLVLFGNVEDGEDINASLFTMESSGPVFAGSTGVFVPNAPAGETPAPGVKADAYVASVKPGPTPVFERELYQREGKGQWKLAKPLAVFPLQNDRQDGWEPKLMTVMSLDGVDEAKVEKALSALTSYTDVYSTISAGPPRNEGERLVASNAALRLMELLDIRAAVYAVENATKQEVAHDEPGKYALSLDGLTTVEAVRDAYIKHTNESLGGESPYAPTP